MNNKDDLSHVIIMDDPYEKPTKKQLKAIKKRFKKKFKLRLNNKAVETKIISMCLYKPDEVNKIKPINENKKN